MSEYAAEKFFKDRFDKLFEQDRSCKYYSLGLANGMYVVLNVLKKTDREIYDAIIKGIKTDDCEALALLSDALVELDKPLSRRAQSIYDRIQELRSSK